MKEQEFNDAQHRSRRHVKASHGELVIMSPCLGELLGRFPLPIDPEAIAANFM